MDDDDPRHLPITDAAGANAIADTLDALAKETGPSSRAWESEALTKAAALLRAHWSGTGGYCLPAFAVGILTVQPGDVIVVTADNMQDDQHRQVLINQVKQLWPDNPVAIVPPDVQVTTQSADDGRLYEVPEFTQGEARALADATSAAANSDDVLSPLTRGLTFAAAEAYIHAAQGRDGTGRLPDLTAGELKRLIDIIVHCELPPTPDGALGAVLAKLSSVVLRSKAVPLDTLSTDDAVDHLLAGGRVSTDASGGTYSIEGDGQSTGPIPFDQPIPNPKVDGGTIEREGKQSIKYLSLTEFRNLGYLQEVNRLVLHPAGLALELLADAKTGHVSAISGVWDYRDDPEGITYGPDLLDPAKIQSVAQETLAHAEARSALFGSTIQWPPS